MPRVPLSGRPIPSANAPQPMPADDWLLMAAAQMHSEGRLVESTPQAIPSPAIPSLGMEDEV